MHFPTLTQQNIKSLTTNNSAEKKSIVANDPLKTVSPATTLPCTNSSQSLASLRAWTPSFTLPVNIEKNRDWSDSDDDSLHQDTSDLDIPPAPALTTFTFRKREDSW